MNVTHRTLSDIRMMYSRRSDTEIRNAFHEAGHALVALGFGVELREVTIKPNTSAGYAGRILMRADSRGWGSDEQQITIYAAGRAGEEIGPFRLDDAWTQGVRYRSDLTMIEDLIPDCTEKHVSEAVEMAKRCIRAWPHTFDRIVSELLIRGALEWPDVLRCVPDRERALADYWKRFAVPDAPAIVPAVKPIIEPVVQPAPKPTARPAARHGFTQAEAIRVLEQLQTDLRFGRFVPAQVKRLVAQIEDTTPTRGRGHGLEYGEPVMLETRHHEQWMPEGGR